MECDQQEVKGHWCKVCGKSFPCGRSLGGHMRSHLSSSSPAPEADERSIRGSKSCVSGSRKIGFGLRENPKKSWRLSETADTAKESGKSCKQCNRVFPTLKSLFGHMRCHSQKLHCKLEDENAEEVESARGMKRKSALMENEAGTELVMPRRKKKRSRLKSISGSSSSSSETNREEDAALTLMMLSRDTDFRTCVNSMEAPILNSFSEAKDILKRRKGDSECRIQNHINGPKSSDSDVSFDELALGDAFMKLRTHADDADDTDHSLEAAKNSSIKKCLNLSTDDMFPEAFGNKLSPTQVSIVSDGDLHKAPEKKIPYKCPLCNKMFNSYRSFVGHQTSHIKRKGCAGTKNEGKKNKSRSNAYERPKIIVKIVDKNVCIGTGSGSTNKVNKYTCSICCKVFSSSQALGGHKRSHLFANSRNDAYNISKRLL